MHNDRDQILLEALSSPKNLKNVFGWGCGGEAGNCEPDGSLTEVMSLD